jgi:DNA-binding NarL/FixJ family response regulator
MNNSALNVYNIMLISDHRILRQGLRVLLEKLEDFSIVAEADSNSAVELIRKFRPAIVILDLNVPLVDTETSLLARIRQLQLDTRVIVLLPDGEQSTQLVMAIRDGAMGCVAEDTGDINVVVEAIRKVGQGQLFFSNTSLISLIATLSDNERTEPINRRGDVNALSPREYEVLELVALGYTNRQISARLVISESTARTHVHNILDKLNLENRVQAAAFALKRPPSIPNKSTNSRLSMIPISEAGA